MAVPQRAIGFKTTGAGARRVGRLSGSPVVGFVKTVAPPAVTQAPAQRLEEAARSWLDSINARKLSLADDLIAEDAVYHDDGMWLLQPARGRTAIRKVWRDWLRSVPDYQIEPVQMAVEAATSDVFVLWRASGQAKLSVIPQRPTTNKPFEHYGVTRLHFDAVTNQITDQWTWRGASTDEAKWLLTRSYKPFDYDTFLSSSSSSGADEQHALSPGQLAAAAAQAAAAAAAGSSSAFGGVADGSTAQRARAKGSALLFREVFGAVPGSDVAQLDAALSADYRCQEATGVWRGMNLASREACISYCQQRQKQLSGSPHWHSEAMSSDGKLLFVHFQNVLTDRQSKTLAGLSSGVLVHVFDGWQRINRTLMFRGPMSLSERAEFFNMDCRACGRDQAQTLGVSDSVLGGM
ncbi:hypothetical protein OEZ86_007806 [Tetradesmus obliquus]|nr:hypothetical protein OEZ86_007806 [Tetradesmus obliquus]